jgi:hypothetical protein
MTATNRLCAAALAVLTFPWPAQAGLRIGIGIGVPEAYYGYRPSHGPSYGRYVVAPLVFVAPAPVHVDAPATPASAAPALAPAPGNARPVGQRPEQPSSSAYPPSTN